jgi:predicted metal-dependent HD superfamily phosphohydrolase
MIDFETAKSLSGPLAERYLRLYSPLEVKHARASFAQLFEAYREPHRHYHVLGHIESCLKVADALPYGLVDRHYMQHDAELALWWHDVVYDTARHDNEEASARKFAEEEESFALSTIECVQACILATAHKSDDLFPLARYVVDVDLSILGEDEDVYAQYVRDVRQEYAFVSEDAWRVGRKAVLEGFLARPTIYGREDFRERYEKSARRNIAGELERLR